jgi:hypothetical protein
MREPTGCPVCPVCSQPPVFVLGGGTQAFCGNEDCRVFVWDSTLSRDELLARESRIEWEDR